MGRLVGERCSCQASAICGMVASCRRAMASRIEAVTGLDWVEALCRTRAFSEYMLYGYFVENDASFSDRHRPVSRTQCVSYWAQSQLSKRELHQLLRGADKDDVAFSIASFSGTPVQNIRVAIEEMRSIRTPRIATRQPAGLDALC